MVIFGEGLSASLVEADNPLHTGWVLPATENHWSNQLVVATIACIARVEIQVLVHKWTVVLDILDSPGDLDSKLGRMERTENETESMAGLSVCSHLSYIIYCRHLKCYCPDSERGLWILL